MQFEIFLFSNTMPNLVRFMASDQALLPLGGSLSPMQKVYNVAFSEGVKIQPNPNNTSHLLSLYLPYFLQL